MEKYDYKNHWENAYNTPISKLGWYEDDPIASIELIQKSNISKNSLIFNAGAGCSFLIGNLLKIGYKNLIINDISSKALEYLKSQIGETKNVKYIIDDLTNPMYLNDIEMVDLWHDRAVLHFFVDPLKQKAYFNLLKDKIKVGGYALFSEFAIGGASKCCGLDVLNYSEEMFEKRLGKDFKLLESKQYLYSHPSNGNTRKYIYTIFRRIR